MATTKNPTAAEIWNTLSKVDVNEHTQDKGGLTYLSWAWAWGVMMKHYPDLSIEWHRNSGGATEVGTDAIAYPGGTVMVSCTVTIGYEGTSAVRRTMWLPVMDYRNKAITNPDTRAISDSKMRCMTKCFALFGLGHYIYAGEDLPQGGGNEAEINTLIKQVKEIGTLLKETGAEVDPMIGKRANDAIKGRDADALRAIKLTLETIKQVGSNK